MKTKLISKQGLRKNVIWDAKEENGKFYAWISPKGAWERVAKKSIHRVEV